MNPYTNNLEEIYTELETVKDQMEGNIHHLTSNVVKLEDLDQKASQIEQQSEIFKNKTSQFKYKDLCLKITIASVVVIVLGGLILIFIISNIYGKQTPKSSIRKT